MSTPTQLSCSHRSMTICSLSYSHRTGVYTLIKGCLGLKIRTTVNTSDLTEDFVAEISVFIIDYLVKVTLSCKATL